MNALATSWADALLRASVQGGITIAAVWILTKLVRSMPAALTVWLWRLAIAKLFVALLLPIVLTSRGDGGPVGFVSSPGTLQVAAFVLAASVGGGFLVLVQLSQEAIEVARIRRLSNPWADPSIHEIACRLGLKADPLVLVSAAIDRPVVLGPFRPAVVLPEALVEVGGPDVRMVLAHELAHIRRRDLAWGWLPMAAEAAFFFHPLVWVARRQLRAAQEAACDRMAVETIGSTPWEYGRLLLRLAQGKTDRAYSAPLAASALSGYLSLKARIDTLVAPCRAPHPLARTLCLLTAVLLLPAWRLQPSAEPQSNLPEDGPSVGALAAPVTRFAHEVPVKQKTTLEEGQP